MHYYKEVALTYENSKALLPCNIFKIQDCYDEDEKKFEFNNNGAYLTNLVYAFTDSELPDDLDTVYINYIGIPVDDDGNLLIPEQHVNACITYCKLQIIEEDMFAGKVPYTLWKEFDLKFSGQISAAKSSMQHFTSTDFRKLNVIDGNLLVKIADLELSHNKFKEV